MTHPANGNMPWQSMAKMLSEKSHSQTHAQSTLWSTGCLCERLLRMNYELARETVHMNIISLLQFLYNFYVAFGRPFPTCAARNLPAIFCRIALSNQWTRVFHQMLVRFWILPTVSLKRSNYICIKYRWRVASFCIAQDWSWHSGWLQVLFDGWPTYGSCSAEACRSSGNRPTAVPMKKSAMARINAFIQFNIQHMQIVAVWHYSSGPDEQNRSWLNSDADLYNATNCSLFSFWPIGLWKSQNPIRKKRASMPGAQCSFTIVLGDYVIRLKIIKQNTLAQA